jgi:hypothetical protein
MTISGIQARIEAIVHKILHPTHKIIWKYDPALPICDGDIYCENCNKAFWCRFYDKSKAEREKLLNE